mmetsp:Transcript_27933/g.34102  ORF Transcript_27933/g.34102 Transcript_27933/m.34102 type:complete len:225 (-) Transcript_27933:32-706(-)
MQRNSVFSSSNVNSGVIDGPIFNVNSSIINTHVLPYIPTALLVSYAVLLQLVKSTTNCVFRDECGNYYIFIYYCLPIFHVVVGALIGVQDWFSDPNKGRELRLKYSSFISYFILKLLGLMLYIFLLLDQPLKVNVKQKYAEKISLIQVIGFAIGFALLTILSRFIVAQPPTQAGINIPLNSMNSEVNLVSIVNNKHKPNNTNNNTEQVTLAAVKSNENNNDYSE